MRKTTLPLARARRFSHFLFVIFLVVLLLSGAAACSALESRADEPRDLSQTGRPEPLKVIATTSIVGDVVRQVGGEQVAVETLLPQDADPHGFEPAPRDIARIADADLVFANGAGLEAFLQPLIQNAGGDATLVEVSRAVDLLQSGHDDTHSEPDHDADEHAGEGDPHVWMDPENVVAWTRVVEETLAEADPQSAALYAANAENYRQQLVELDGWITEQVAQVPADRRELVVDHLAFTYFANAYGFQQAAALIPGFSTLAEPSAQELAQLEDSIKQLGVKVIFVGNTVNPALAERVAADTGTRLVRLYTGSLSGAGGEAGTYLDYMRYNVGAIVTALKP